MQKGFIWGVFLLTGCDLTVPYVSTVPLPEKGTARVAVATVDERADILDKQHPPNYVGIMRGRVGIPLDRLTHDGRPLSEDFSGTMANSLSANGYVATAIATSPAGNAAEALKQLELSGAARLVLLELRDWRSETYTNSTISYDAVLHVYDGAGKELASKADAGKEDTSHGSFFNPIYRSDDILVQFYEHEVQEWLSDPKIEAALQD